MTEGQQAQDPEEVERLADAAVARGLEVVPGMLPVVGVEPEEVGKAEDLAASEEEPHPFDEAERMGHPAVAGPVLAEPAVAEPALAELALAEPATLVLERKHPLAIRWMHWINFPVLFTMMWSGLLIYWNDSIPPGSHAHQVYRVGVGGFTLFRFFPDWFYSALNVQYQVTKGLSYHFFFMWIFAINGIVYAAYLLWSKEWKFMVPQRRSVRDAIQVTLVDLHVKNKSELPPQTKYNGGQRIAYSSVLVMGLGSLVTGLAIYKPTQTHWLTTLLGGYEMARWLHFWLTIAFCGFFLVHVLQVVLAGWNNFRAMISGYELRGADEPSLEAERREF